MYIYNFKQKCLQFLLHEAAKGVFSIFFLEYLFCALDSPFSIISFSISHYS